MRAPAAPPIRVGCGDALLARRHDGWRGPTDRFPGQTPLRPPARRSAPPGKAWRSLQGWPDDAEFALLRIYDEATAWELSTLDYPGAERFSPEDCLYIDTHGGFLGDGATFARLRFAPEDGAALEQVLAEEGGWQALPVTGVAADRVNWGLPIDDCYRTTEERPEFPEVTDGLWHFRNTTPDGDGV